MNIGILTSFYGLTLVTTFIAQSQLNIKLRNKLYADKYIETEKNRKLDLKEIMVNTIKFLLPVYNIAASVYYLRHMDKYYNGVKEELLAKGYLEKVEIKEEVLDVLKKTDLEKEEPINTYIWGNNIEEEIEYVKPKQKVKTYK